MQEIVQDQLRQKKMIAGMRVRVMAVRSWTPPDTVRNQASRLLSAGLSLAISGDRKG